MRACMHARARVRVRLRVLIVSLSAARCSAIRQKGTASQRQQRCSLAPLLLPFFPPHSTVKIFSKLFTLCTHPAQDQVLGESTMMIGDCKTRMENAFNDLLAAVVRARTLFSTIFFPPHANASLSLHARRGGRERNNLPKNK